MEKTKIDWCDSTMKAAVHSGKLDVVKVFEVIALILSRRGEGNVRLVGVSKAKQEAEKAG